jgi:hypothetical protein
MTNLQPVTHFIKGAVSVVTKELYRLLKTQGAFSCAFFHTVDKKVIIFFLN